MSGIDIAVVGSANLDLVVHVDEHARTGETVLGSDVVEHPGGKGANQAVAAARLGRRVEFVGAVGDDAAALLLRASMSAAGVGLGGLATVEAPTGLAFISVDADGDNAIVVSPGANRELTASHVEANRMRIEAAGVVLAQLEVPLAAIERAAAFAARLVLNPAPAARLAPEILSAQVDVLVPNRGELATLVGVSSLDDAELAEAARSIGVESVVVTLGADGALCVDAVSADLIPAPVITPVDTTAAGDAFCGALADAIVRKQSLRDATRWAVRVGAAATLRDGAQPSLPTVADVETLTAP